MICFLTSRMDDPDTGKLNSANRFADELRKHFPDPCRALVVCSDPDDPEKTDYYSSLTREMLEEAGFGFERFPILDGRNASRAASLVRESNLLILSGGHVPTQNRFLDRIHLRGLLSDFQGVVIGISAGSMNSAELVYAQPEEEGEAVDPDYQRFLTGLNLTKTNLLPHYQENKDVDDAYKEARELLKAAQEKELPRIAGEINAQMVRISDAILGPEKEAPRLDLKDGKSYTFGTSTNFGTGNNYKNLIIYDLSILTKTDLPAVIHDSFLLTDIGDTPTGQIVKQYLEIAKLGKQVFIALDKTQSYGPETDKDLNDNQVLYLSENSNELYGWSWDQKVTE